MSFFEKIHTYQFEYGRLKTQVDLMEELEELLKSLLVAILEYRLVGQRMEESDTLFRHFMTSFPTMSQCYTLRNTHVMYFELRSHFIQMVCQQIVQVSQFLPELQQMLGKPHEPRCTLGFQCPDSGYDLTTECQNGQRSLIDLITEVRFRFRDIIRDLFLFFLMSVTPKDASVSILTGVQQVDVYESTIINLYRVLPHSGELMEELGLQLKQRLKANGKAVDSLNEQALAYEKFLYPVGNPFLAQLKNNVLKELHPE